MNTHFSIVNGKSKWDWKALQTDIAMALKPSLIKDKNFLLTLNKTQLEKIGRNYGVELDRRRSIANLVNDLLEVIND